MTTHQVSMLAGVSLRQLQWWYERGVLRVPISSHKRLYTEDDARMVRVVAALRKKGLSLQQVRTLLPIIRKAKAARGNVVVYLCRRPAFRKRVQLYDDMDGAMEAAIGAEGPVVMVRVP